MFAMAERSALVFGSSGAIGSAVVDEFSSNDFKVVEAPRSLVDIERPDGLDAIAELPELSAVVWSQGISGSDSVGTFDDDIFMQMFNANCRFVALTLRELLQHGRIVRGAKLCVISSIWQDRSRRDRFSYSVTKAAIGGLVRSAAVDLAEQNILINAVLPGTVDTPMTRRPGSSAQDFPAWTPHDRLLTSEEIAKTAVSLCSDANSGITGQSIPVDLGSMTSFI